MTEQGRNGESLFLVCGTAQERAFIARERGIDPRSIRLVQSARDIFGHHGGRIIIGNTGFLDDFDEVIAYAKTHGIEVP